MSNYLGLNFFKDRTCFTLKNYSSYVQIKTEFNATVTDYLSYAVYRGFSDVLYLILAVVQMFNV